MDKNDALNALYNLTTRKQIPPYGKLRIERIREAVIIRGESENWDYSAWNSFCRPVLTVLYFKQYNEKLLKCCLGLMKSYEVNPLSHIPNSEETSVFAYLDRILPKAFENIKLRQYVFEYCSAIVDAICEYGDLIWDVIPKEVQSSLRHNKDVDDFLTDLFCACMNLYLLERDGANYNVGRDFDTAAEYLLREYEYDASAHLHKARFKEGVEAIFFTLDNFLETYKYSSVLINHPRYSLPPANDNEKSEN